MKRKAACIMIMFIGVFSVIPLAYSDDGNHWLNMKNWELTLGSGGIEKFLDKATLNEGLGHLFISKSAGLINSGFEYGDSESDNDWQNSSRVGLEYYLNFERIKPYVGASIGYHDSGYSGNNDVEGKLVAAPEFGLIVFANATTFLYGQMDYEFPLENDEEAKVNFKDGPFVYSVGIAIKW